MNKNMQTNKLKKMNKSKKFKKLFQIEDCIVIFIKKEKKILEKNKLKGA